QTETISVLVDKYCAERPGIQAELHRFTSGEELLESLAAGVSGVGYDLLLLDILMPGLSGIELAAEIRKQNNDVAIIFLTSSTDHALEAFGVSAAQYLVKPVKASSFFPALDKVCRLLAKEKEPDFTLPMPERTVKIPFSSIVCVELVNRKLQVYLENNEKLIGRYIRTTFEIAVAPLLKDSRFFHAHKSFVINIEHAGEFTGNAFVMSNNIHVPVSRHKLTEAKDKYLSGAD
ncbi:MAG: LytTR family DNA-binding domain-containing protein, partial [Defluviitaleaceae bacterium]|nr:LytTR family DNA-binding domain-containing protein [Defluviitaleaceae bacterium]